MVHVLEDRYKREFQFYWCGNVMYHLRNLVTNVCCKYPAKLSSEHLIHVYLILKVNIFSLKFERKNICFCHLHNYISRYVLCKSQ